MQVRLHLVEFFRDRLGDLGESVEDACLVVAPARDVRLRVAQRGDAFGERRGLRLGGGSRGLDPGVQPFRLPVHLGRLRVDARAQLVDDLLPRGELPREVRLHLIRVPRRVPQRGPQRRVGSLQRRRPGAKGCERMRELLGDQRALVHLELVRGELRELGRGRGLVVIAAALGFLLLRGHIDPAGAMRLLRVFPLWRRIGPKWD